MGAARARREDAVRGSSTTSPGHSWYRGPLDLPTDAAEIYERIEQAAEEAFESDAQFEEPAEPFDVYVRNAMFAHFSDVLREARATPEQRAAAYEALARVPGLTLVGEVTDRLGRTGVAVALDIVENEPSDFLYRYMLVFDPETADLLEEQREFFPVTGTGDFPPARSRRTRLRVRDRRGTRRAAAGALNSAAAAQGDPGQDLPDDPVGGERGDVGRADRRRDHLDDVDADELELGRQRPCGPQEVDRRHPTGLRRAGAGRERGVEDVNVDRQEDGPVAHEADRAADDLLDPQLAHVVHEVAGDAVLGLPRELGLARPVAAQADLDVTARVDVALLDEPVERGAVRDLDTEDLGSGVGMGVEVDEPDGAVHRRDRAMSGSEMEWSPPSTTGIGPAASTCPTSASIAACVLTGSAGITGASPKSTTRSSTKASSFASRCGPGGTLAARMARGRSARRAVGDEVVGGSADDRHVGARELGGSCVCGTPA